MGSLQYCGTVYTYSCSGRVQWIRLCSSSAVSHCCISSSLIRGYSRHYCPLLLTTQPVQSLCASGKMAFQSLDKHSQVTIELTAWTQKGHFMETYRYRYTMTCQLLRTNPALFYLSLQIAFKDSACQKFSLVPRISLVVQIEMTKQLQKLTNYTCE